MVNHYMRLEEWLKIPKDPLRPEDPLIYCPFCSTKFLQGTHSFTKPFPDKLPTIYHCHKCNKWFNIQELDSETLYIIKKGAGI